MTQKICQEVLRANNSVEELKSRSFQKQQCKHQKQLLKSSKNKSSPNFKQKKQFYNKPNKLNLNREELYLKKHRLNNLLKKFKNKR